MCKIKNPYKLSDEFFKLSKDESDNKIEDFYAEFLDSIDDLDDFDEDYIETIKITYLSKYLDYKDKSVNYFNN
jgi:hypothetical protein